jgi:hypothetical protein
MALFITYGQNVYKITRETPKTIFYKNVLPNKSFKVPTGIVYHFNYFGYDETLEYYNPDDLQLGEKEMKMLKTKFNPTKIISPDELRNTFFNGSERVPITEELKLNHAFFHDDNFKLLKETYEIRYFIYSLLCKHLHTVIRLDNDEDYKRTFNKLLQDFSLYLQTLDYSINDKIHLMASTLGKTTLQEDLLQVLLLEPY